MTNKKKLTNKQKKYIDEVIQDPLHTINAVRKVYDCNTKGSEHTINWKLKNNDKVQEEIDLYMEKLRKVELLTPEQIKAGITELAISSRTKTGEKLKAYELLSKIARLFKDNDETMVNLYNVNDKDK